MEKSSTMGFQNRSLQRQGYSQYSEQELSSLRFGLRFTSTLCMIGAIVALVTQLPTLHFGLAALGIIPMWLPAKHLIPYLGMDPLSLVPGVVRIGQE